MLSTETMLTCRSMYVTLNANGMLYLYVVVSLFVSDLLVPSGEDIT